MIYYTNLFLPRKASASTKFKCFSQEAVRELSTDINKTIGCNVLKTEVTETDYILTIALNSDIVEGKPIHD